MTYSFSNVCAKNCCKWTVRAQIIVKDVVTFLEYSAHAAHGVLTVINTHTP